MAVAMSLAADRREVRALINASTKQRGQPEADERDGEEAEDLARRAGNARR